MKTVVIEVRSLEDSLASAAQTMATGQAEEEARIAFATPELLWQVFTAKRWELLKVLRGAGPLSEGPRSETVVALRPRGATTGGR